MEPEIVDPEVPGGTGDDPVLEVPPLVAVVVTHDPGPWFAETLQSLAEQTYPDLAVLVIDTASAEDPGQMVHAALPAAHVHYLDHDPGFARAANLVRELVEGATFYAFCHDDIALEPDALRILVEEAFRSNAGVIGPKLVSWDDPDVLLQVGMGADKTGALVPIIEPGELDQEQQDAVRDVFAVPGACTVVRADLFEALDGFDEGIDLLGEDLDLCWRTHIAGARVMICPSARVRHLQALDTRTDPEGPSPRRRIERHRLRTASIAYGPFHRLRVLPQAFIVALVEIIHALLTGRPTVARDIAAAWPWNLRRHADIRARRKAIKQIRHVSDAEVRELQVSGSARLTAAFRGRMHTDTGSTRVRSSRDLAGSFREGSRQFTGTFVIVLAALLAISSRDLVLSGIPAIGEFARFPQSPGPLLAAWWSGWQRGGLGGAGASATGFGLLGVMGIGFLGAMNALRTVLILGTIPLGALGAWRLARPIGSSRASAAAFAVYLAIPVPYNALASGSWSGLLVYAAAPWILLALGRAAGIEPFADEAHPPRRVALGLGLLLAVTASFVPAILVVAAVMAAAVIVGSLLCFRVAGLLRIVAVLIGATAFALVLQLPWSLDLIRAPSPWESVAGLGATDGGVLGLGRILRFETGPWGAPPLGWAFLLAGALPIIIGRGWRLEWAVRAWAIILTGWALLWLSQQGDLPVGLPTSEVVLAPVAAALALATALGLAAFEIDLRAYRFGWRQILAVAAALGVVLGAVPLAAGLLDGRWRTPTTDYVSSVGDLLTTEGRAPFRVVWLGDADVLPVAGWRFDAQTTYSATDRGVPTVLDRLPGPPPGATPVLAAALHDATSGRTTRLGHLLAPMGVRYLVLPGRLAPSAPGAAGRTVPAPALSDTLAQQLDLEEVPVAEGLLVYRNLAWVPSRALLRDRSGDRTSYRDAVSDDLTGARPALVHDQGAVNASGRVPGAGDVLVASSSDPDWHLQVNGVELPRSTTYGWANQFAAPIAGSGTLTYDTPAPRRLASIGQAVAWFLVVALWLLSRRRRRSAPAEEGVV